MPVRARTALMVLKQHFVCRHTDCSVNMGGELISFVRFSGFEIQTLNQFDPAAGYQLIVDMSTDIGWWQQHLTNRPFDSYSFGETNFFVMVRQA